MLGRHDACHSGGVLVFGMGTPTRGVGEGLRSAESGVCARAAWGSGVDRWGLHLDRALEPPTTVGEPPRVGLALPGAAAPDILD